MIAWRSEPSAQRSALSYSVIIEWLNVDVAHHVTRDNATRTMTVKFFVPFKRPQFFYSIRISMLASLMHREYREGLNTIALKAELPTRWRKFRNFLIH